MALSIEQRPAKSNVSSLILSQGACLGGRFGPRSGCMREAMDRSFSPSLSLSLKKLIKPLEIIAAPHSLPLRKLSRLHTYSHPSTHRHAARVSLPFTPYLTVNRGYLVYLSGLDWADFLKPDDETKHMLHIWQFLTLERSRGKFFTT